MMWRWTSRAGARRAPRPWRRSCGTPGNFRDAFARDIDIVEGQHSHVISRSDDLTRFMSLAGDEDEVLDIQMDSDSEEEESLDEAQK